MFKLSRRSKCVAVRKFGVVSKSSGKRRTSCITNLRVPLSATLNRYCSFDRSVTRDPFPPPRIASSATHSHFHFETTHGARLRGKRVNAVVGAARQPNATVVGMGLEWPWTANRLRSRTRAIWTVFVTRKATGIVKIIVPRCIYDRSTCLASGEATLSLTVLRGEEKTKERGHVQYAREYILYSSEYFLYDNRNPGGAEKEELGGPWTSTSLEIEGRRSSWPQKYATRTCRCHWIDKCCA